MARRRATSQKDTKVFEELEFFVHPLTQLAVVSLAMTAALRLLFFHFSEWIWEIPDDVTIQEITPWTRWALWERDGSEPQVLLLLIVALALLTVLGMQLLKLAPAWLREVLLPGCLVAAAIFALAVPPRAPIPDVDGLWWHVLEVEAGVFLAALTAGWAAGKRGFPVVLAAVLAPVSFLAVTLPSHNDLSCILAPALKLRLGFSPSQIYLQYDYLLALLAEGWHKVGGAPFAFFRVTQASLFLLLMGVFLLARSMFLKPRIAGMLVVALIAVRVYGIQHDANAVPQVTPLRIDLWILLLAATLIFGLRHWSVGLTAGLIYFFARSFGILYLGSYGLALLADFCVRRVDAKERIPLWREIAAYVRSVAPALLLICAGLLAARWVFGSVVSDATLIYRRLGLGMMRIAPDSFYWWIAPALAATGWLIFSLRGVIGERRASASFFLLALGIGNSIYFFGRSHEHNLLNISTSLLFCVFLGIDLGIAAWGTGPHWARWTIQAVPWLILAFIGYFYSGRLAAKVSTQFESVAMHRPLPVSDYTGVIDCREIAAVAKDSRVFVYGMTDYWFYEQCGYVPPGYIQPLWLQALRMNLIEQLDHLLDAGYKIVVPKTHAYGFDFSDVEPSLKGIERIDTIHYEVYYRKR
jgi:hypothetical protein